MLFICIFHNKYAIIASLVNKYCKGLQGLLKKLNFMGKVIQYFIEVKSEIAKVVWPSKEDTVRYTLVVIAFALIMALILGATDYGLTSLITKFVNH